MKRLVVPLFLFVNLAFADEGMWLLNDFPVKKVQSKYQFAATPEWLDHVRLSSARLAGGCSGSFVSKNGLVMTNHHCAHSCIEQLSKAKQDYVAQGFYAKTEKDEMRCPEIEVNRLETITDVTAKITASTKNLAGQAYNDAQKATMAKIEKDCSGGNDNIRCDVVTLYHGGQYHLYEYHRYQDVRLVFAPEIAIAFFGGDPDNFNFPRYDLDVSFLRVYENNKPLENKEFFRWSVTPAQEGDLTFVTGHPGNTSRLLTVSELEHLRDFSLIRRLVSLSEYRGFLTEYGNRGPEQRRTSEADLFGVENGLKAMKGRHQALLDKKFFAQKVNEENTLRKKINTNPKWKKDFASAWDEMAKAQSALKDIKVSLEKIEQTSYGSDLFWFAKNIVRSGVELQKPNEKRFREFNDSKLPQLKQELFSEAPIYEEFEIAKLTHGLTKMREDLKVDHPFVKKVLGLKSPADLAKELVKGTRLKDPKYRKELFEGGQKAIDASKDPMIQLALAIDPEARAIRKKFEDEIEPVIKKEGERVAKAQFAVNGANTYPDATFTLRVSYGVIRGYKENGKQIDPITRMSGTFDRHTGSDPFALPQSWLNAKAKLDLNTPMNFSSDNDIIGGNSGSPVINKNAEVVGLIFDGNIQSLGGDYGFDDSVNRAVSVHSAALLESLKKIYKADRVVSDLTGDVK